MTPRVWVVTGAGGTLGSALIKRLVGNGDNVAAVFHRREAAVSTEMIWHVDPLSSRRQVNPVFAIYADLGEPQDIQMIVEFSCAKFGSIDVLINCAAHSVWGGLLHAERSLRSFEMQFAVNTKAPIALALAFAHFTWMKDDELNRLRNRHVLNLSSTAGITVYPDRGQSVYSASKAALNFLTLHAADEFRHIGVRVNALLPTSFPSVISIESVLEQILRLDKSTDNGVLLAIDVDGAEEI